MRDILNAETSGNTYKNEVASSVYSSGTYNYIDASGDDDTTRWFEIWKRETSLIFNASTFCLF